MITTAITPKSCGFDLDLSPAAFGGLADSSHHLDSPETLRETLREDGYLFLRGVFDPDLILEARRNILLKMRAKGCLNPAAPLMDGVLLPGTLGGFSPGLATNEPSVDRVVFGPEIKGFYGALLGGPIRHFDFKWLRSIGPGKGTNPHCDIVYMGRGTFDLFTAWIPYGEVDQTLGGLMILEGSHRQQERLRPYLGTDVDAYCANRPIANEIESGRRHWSHPGWLSTNPRSLREKLGGRWLTADFRPGDLLTFGMATVHASLDNQTPDRVRISTDTRYQLASEPVDERWVGANPVGHGLAGKRGRIC